MKSFMLLILGCILLGCTSTSVFKDYKINEIRTVRVGEIMISWGFEETRPMVGGAGYKSGIKSELQFNGTDDKTIYIAYREFSTDGYGTAYAKPAFNNELKYKTDTKILRYKEYELEVISITEESLTFKILKD